MFASKPSVRKQDPAKVSYESQMTRSVLQRLIATRLFGGAALATLGTLVGILGWEIYALVDVAAPAAAAPVFCGPTTFHTMSEPPEVQLTRDYALVKVLLYDPGDHFEQIGSLYDGTLRPGKTRRRTFWLVKPSERTKMFQPALADAPHSANLRDEARRVDRLYGTAIASEIEAGLAMRNRNRTEAAFRRLFTVLIEELLTLVQNRLNDRSTDSATITRTFQYVRRYYSAALQAHLAVNTPANSRDATEALDAMSRALDTFGIEAAGPVSQFRQAQSPFLRSIHSGQDGDTGHKPL